MSSIRAIEIIPLDPKAEGAIENCVIFGDRIDVPLPDGLLANVRIQLTEEAKAALEAAGWKDGWLETE